MLMPVRWLRVLIPLVLFAAWLGISAIGGPTFGTISEVTNNDQSSYLPASAESTKVQALQDRFFASKTVPAVVLYVRDSGLTAADLRAVDNARTAIAALPGLDSLSPAVPSSDGKAVEIFAPVRASADGMSVIGAVRAASVQGLPSGLSAFVTGPAALGADFGAGFSGIDGILLLVALAAVFIILLIVYRSLLLPVIVLVTSVFALTGSILVVYLVAKAGWVTVTGQSRGILAILALGAATDYSLLLVSRFREALRGHRTPWEAMTVAWRRSIEPIAASAATVILGVLCLLLSGLNSNRGLGPVAAIAIALSFFAAVTALPAMLLLTGRAAFWPFRPRFDPKADDETVRVPISRLWRNVGRLISGRPRITWIVAVLLLGVCALGVLQLKASGVPQSDLLLTQSDSVDGQKLLAKHFDAGSGSPVLVVVPESFAAAVLSAVKGTAGITTATYFTAPTAGAPSHGAPTTAVPPVLIDGDVLIEATLASAADSDAARNVVVALRGDSAISGPGALVGGVTAVNLDTNTTATRDLGIVIPSVLIVIFIVLALLLRSLVAPLLLVGTVVLSFAATLGISAVVFNHVLKFPGADPTVPLFGFVFLVALGVDYNIFLMTRVREEAFRIGTRPGIVHALGATGGVITSAGIVLAATFSALGVIPILFLVQIAFVVAFGVLLDTILVRSLLLPALAYDIGAKIWWPSKLSLKQ